MKLGLIGGIAVALLVGGVACGGLFGGSPTGPSSDTPQAFNTTVTGTVSAFGNVRHPFSAPRGGNQTIRLTWQDATVDLDLYLAVNACTVLYPQSSCGILAASNAGQGVVNEQINRTVTAGEGFSVWVDNLHLSRPQNYSIQLTIQ